MQKIIYYADKPILPYLDPLIRYLLEQKNYFLQKYPQIDLAKWLKDRELLCIHREHRLGNLYELRGGHEC